MGDSTPICRCRVLYLGSAVPRQSKDGLQGIQEPLRSLYPLEGAIGAKGIDSWLSVWSNGILLENVDENLKEITRFFPIESLHYCAAVRQVLIPERGNSNPEPKFLPLDSPFARMPRAQHPPIFAAILRRTTGIKVLECHVFICKREAAANALVRCCFHAYADNSYARQLETGSTDEGAGSSMYGTLKSNGGSKFNVDLPTAGVVLANGTHSHPHTSSSVSHAGWRSRAGSITTLNSVGRQSNGGLQINGDSTSSAAEGYTSVKNFYGSSADLNGTVDDGSLYNGDANHKVWNGSQDQLDNIALENHYDMYSGQLSTLGRPARLRQISHPVNVPPPPMRDDSNKKKKDKKLSKSSSSQSLSGTLIRPKPIHAAAVQRGAAMHFPGPGPMYGGPMPGPVPLMRNYHTISHRGFPPPGPMHHPPPPSHIISPPPTMHPQILPPPPHVGMPMQHTLVVPQQYATLQPSNSTKKKKRDKKHAGIPVGMPIVPSIYAYHQNPAGPPPNMKVAQPLMAEPRPLGMSSRKLAASMGNGLDDSGLSGADSPGGTGIYRRKGHLNERAFSYSIRQEHRSRSHGSLASLQFNPPDMKKEREIAQMVAGLDINDAPEDHHYHHQHQHQHQHQHHHHQQQHPAHAHHQRGGIGAITVETVPTSHKHAAVINGNGAIYGNGQAAIYGSSNNFAPQRR